MHIMKNSINTAELKQNVTFGEKNIFYIFNLCLQSQQQSV